MAAMSLPEWLAAYDELEPERKRVADMFEDANCGEGRFEDADTASFDLNERYRDLAHAAAEVLRTATTETEWGFRHPGFPHAKIGPYVETSWTGGDGWSTGPYKEENVRYYASGKPVVKRTITTLPRVVGEWEEVPHE